MPEQVSLVVQPKGRAWYLFSYFASASMFLVIAVASCTSRETFAEIYSFFAELLSLSRSSFSLRESPGWGHFICYTLLSFSLAGVFSQRRRFLAPLVAGGFGVLMEIVQGFIPSRDSSLLDVGINFLGVSLGFGVYLVWGKFSTSLN